MGNWAGGGKYPWLVMSRYQLPSHDPRACRNSEALGGVGQGPVKWCVARP